MKRNQLLNISILVPLLVLLWGCEPGDPGSPLANQPPITRIIVAPMQPDTTYVVSIDTVIVAPPDSIRIDTTGIDTVIIHHHEDHFASLSPMFHVQWFGHDPDGRVEGYWISVDDGAEEWTTSGDSLMSFEASTVDPDDPARMMDNHTLRIVAQDNEGLRDPVGAEQSLLSINYRPIVDDASFQAAFADSDSVGSNISFTIGFEDANPSGALFQLSLDDQVIAPWNEVGGYQFCNVGDPDIVDAVDQAENQVVDAALLSVGEHTLIVVVKDLGEAMSDSIVRHITVLEDVFPRMTEMTSTYGSASYYPDNSIFYESDTETQFTMTGDASEYYGQVHSYRYQFRFRTIPTAEDDTIWGDWNAWSQWGSNSFGLMDLAVGQYEFLTQCRDFSGTPGDTMLVEASIVAHDFSAKSLLIIDETRDGNGRPGSPDDEQCDTFYQNVTAGLTDWEVSEWDFAAEGFISPLATYDKRIILWHSDDKSEVVVGADENVRLLSEYLDGGGKFILSGWNAIGSFTEETDVVFTSGFLFEYMRIAGGTQNSERDLIGMTAVPAFGYPDIDFDPEKLPGSWDGVDKGWIIEPRWRTQLVGNFVSVTGDSLFNGMGNCLLNKSPINPWRTLTLGFPLYFMMDADAKTFIEKAVADLDE